MSSHSTNIQFKSIYHQVLKMIPFARTQAVCHARHWSIASSTTFCPLSNAVPHTQQALTQLVDVIYAFLVDPLLHYSTDLIIHGFHIWAFGGHWSGEIKSGVSRRKSAIVSSLSCALCVGALSRWNMKLSPGISFMHGSSFSFSSTSW